jgi:hypothetical protein
MHDIESDMFNYLNIQGERRHAIIYQMSDYCPDTTHSS